MNHISETATSLMVPAAKPAAASDGSRPEGVGLSAGIFIGFAALVVLFQVLPGLALFRRSLKEIFGGADRRAEAAKADRSGV